tara:strand:- start:2 stop:304 length:303 start_codon:yes stop_codon:yes gene_type:complete
MIIKILLITSADTLFMNKKFIGFDASGDFNRKTKNPKPVTIKKISKMNMPLEASLAKECTLVKMPDLTKNVPNTLNEKHNMDRNIIHFFIICSPFAIRSE